MQSTRQQHRTACYNGPAGFTLIEVLVALVVLSAGIVIVLQAFERAMVALDSARDAARISSLADNHFESMRAGYEPLTAGSGVFMVPYDNYTWIQTVSEVSGEADSLYEVTLDVGRKGRSSVRTITTYVRGQSER